MQPPLTANAQTAASLLSSGKFDVPRYQREYSWNSEEVTDFWNDLSASVKSGSYFLGLVILTEEGNRKQVVDGQQRLVTLTLLATALYYEAKKRDRLVLADRIQADFIREINYETDEAEPRINLTDEIDNSTFKYILDNGEIPTNISFIEESVSSRIVEAFKKIKTKLQSDLKDDPYKKLGAWTKFLTKDLFFAVFVHPDVTEAYRVFEVINTRGKDLTTADLLKNYILSQTPLNQREERYQSWQNMANQFPDEGVNNFVQFIRHAVTVESGHILPKDLFGFLAGRFSSANRTAPTPAQLMSLLYRELPLYRQMIDPSASGPASDMDLGVFNILNHLGIITVRPLMLAMDRLANKAEAMDYLLRLVVRRIIVGNLGTGNIERRFNEAAKEIVRKNEWQFIKRDFADLNHSRDDFVEQLRKRTLNKRTLGFIRNSIISGSTMPELFGYLHLIWSKNSDGWSHFDGDEAGYWHSTLGNTLLSTLSRRPPEAVDWDGVKDQMLPTAIDGEIIEQLGAYGEWNPDSIISTGKFLAESAAQIWYDS